ncbi:unnamed protein product [Polarella glacialis]|uniref:Uncharacterized protein n=1 Tax=Polarella glacialis TaxID=89957 RepID=A0A813HJT6_POLGL|nr:unnamed protein product [Polarella glacialis]
MISSACLCDRRSFHTENWTPLVAECLKLTTKDLREASKAQERLAAVQSAALVGKSLFGISRLETGSYELLSANVTLTSRGTEFEGKRSHLAQSVESLQCAQLPWQLEPLNVNSRHHHAIQTIASKLNSLVTFPAGTNDTEADQRGAS